MEISLTTWNVGFYECVKKKGAIGKWIIPKHENRTADKLAERILSNSSDIIVLNEFCNGDSNRPQTETPISGKEIVQKLTDANYECIVSDNWYRSVLIAVNKNQGLSIQKSNNGSDDSYLYTVVKLPPQCENISQLNLLGVGVPTGEEKRKRIEEFWKEIILKYADNHLKEQNQATIIAGDLNAFLEEDIASGDKSIFSNYLCQLNERMVDSWKKQYHTSPENMISDDAWTWYSPQGNGRRLDYVFISQNIAPDVSAKHLHADRLEGFSDHSPVRITFKV